jgi:hypothetical protein
MSTNEYFGLAVALSGNHVFVGAYADDGAANAVGDAGGVFRFSFSDAAFTGGTLASSIGARYVGANDLDMRAYLTGSDYFGRSLSVDGRNLVVGALLDDGYANNAADAGAVYLFRYTDLTYSTPQLQGVLGAGYDISILDKSVSTLNAKENDYFGTAVSIDGNRMVVGAPRDDGFNDLGTDRGAVYLYSFTDSAYGGGILEGIIGDGYVGGKNIAITLGNSDYFGGSVSLDGNRLAVGAYGDDGATNTNTDAGAVYLYNFSDSVFSGGVLQATIGRGYTGGKNINATLDNSDYFGWSVSLNGNRVAVGAQRDDGLANARTDSGAVHLYTFSDAAFTGGALQGTMGYNYTGGKNVNVALDTSDYFGSAVSLDGNMLVVGAPQDDGNANALTNSGAAYFYTFSDAVFTGGTLQGRAGYNYTGGKNINVAALEANDWYGANVSLDANRVAIGAEQDDGYNNEAADSGAVYLYDFSDAVFSSGTYQSTIGYKYSGGKNLNLRDNFVSDIGDRFSAVALDGTRLLIGGYQDDPGGHLTNSGSVAMLTFSDSAFSAPTLTGLTGNGYIGGRNTSLSSTSYDTPDNFGTSVSLNGNRLAVGVPNDDGMNNALSNGGAVYLYSIPGGTYDSVLLEGLIGYGYTGGKNMDMSAYLDRTDLFGNSVSLDGNRLAVGAWRDDGRMNNVGDAGAVYLFNFADSAFTGGALQSIIGSGYTGGKNINISTLGGSDYFGYNVSLDGNRLAVGAQRDDGFANNRTDAGAVYLFSFSDAAFTGGTLQGTIGYGYTGGKNYDISTLNNSDYFGSGVSLNGNRLAVGAPYDDGATDTVTDAGAVYLFTFADSLFTTPTLQSRIGKGYTGGKNYDVSTLAAADIFGSSVALDGTVLAVGTPNDQGLNLDTGGRYGAVFLYSFADTSFTNPFYDSAIGYLYTGGKNINIAVAGGFGSTLSMNSGALVVGAPSQGDVTVQLANTGRVYIYRDGLSPVTDGATFAINGGSTVGITASSIAGLLSAAQNVTLQASNDITLSSPILVNNGTGNGGILTLQAGRSIFLNADIVTDDGNLNILANENAVAGVVNAQRDAGAATISMGAGKSIDAGTGSVVFRIDSGAGKTNFLAGDMVLRNITAGSFQALSGAQTGNIINNGVITASNAGDAIIMDAGANFVNNYGAGALVTPSGRWLVYSDHSNYTTMNGLTPDFTAYECVYGGACSISIPGAGNGLLYEYAIKLLTVTLNTSRAYGDANPNLATLQGLYQYSGFDVGDNAGMLDVLPTATIAATATSTATAGTTHAITFAGGSDDKYDYYFIDGLLTIAKKDITATWNGTLTKTYGDINPTVNTSNFTYTGLANSETNSVITAAANYTGIDHTTSAGAYSIGATFTATNYNVTNAPTKTLTINKRDITAAWTGTLSKIYGDANPSVTTGNFTYTGFVNGDTTAAVTASGDFGTTTAATDTGTYSVNGAFTSTNYNVTNTPTTSLTINKRDITGAVNGDAKAYGDTNPVWDWSDVVWSNLANGQDGSVLDALTVSSTATTSSNAGSAQTITLTGFSDNNYNLTGYTAGTLTINKRDITGVVNADSKAYGDANPTWDWSDVVWSNLANGQDGSVLDALTVSSTATTSSNAGSAQTITLTGFSDNNYNLTGSTAGTLTINKRTVTANVGAHTQTYGQSTPQASPTGVTWGNLVNGDTAGGLDAVTFSAPTLLSTSNAGTAHVLTVAALSDNNYQLGAVTPGTLQITQAPLTLTVQNARRPGSSPNPAFTYALSGLQNSEPYSVLSGVTFATAAALDSSAGIYAVTASGGTATNYYVASYMPGTLTVESVNLLPNTYLQTLAPPVPSVTNMVSSGIGNGNTALSSAPPAGQGSTGGPSDTGQAVIVVPDTYAQTTQARGMSALIAITRTIQRFLTE